MVLEFWDVHHRELQGLVCRTLVYWSLLPEASYKANFDVALFEGTNSVGIGVVFRDHSGNVIATLSQKVNSIHSVEMAEALTARRVVVLAREQSLFNMIIEGDFLRVIQALKCSGRCNTLFGNIIEESERLGCSLWQCQISACSLGRE